MERSFRASDFRHSGLFDQIIDSPQIDSAAWGIAFARDVLMRHGPHPLVRDRPIPDSDPAAVMRLARDALAGQTLSEAQCAALQSITHAIEARDFDDGVARARTLYDRLARSDTVRVG